MKRPTHTIPFVILLVSTSLSFGAGFDGRTAANEVLLGFHYGDMSNHEGRNDTDYPINIWPYFEDYLKYMEGDLLKTSYANFWRWWYILERYKGDEKGLAYLDGLVDELLQRGIKTKIDLCWSTWWTLDRDWELGAKLSVGAPDQDDWVHLCDRLARRYRGRIAHWDLQGEANDLKGYWQGKPIQYVQRNYKLGYRAFKRVDPEIRIGVSGASPSVSREKMDEWYATNITSCAGYYDSIPLNYFADIKGADPYEGGGNFYQAIRGFLDQAGQQHIELGMGEASVQWAETTETAGSGSPALSQQKQADRLNQTLGGMTDLGMNKFILWATEFAPGGGHWAWRWGLRNYEDWWGIWPEQFKVPGTQIIYRYDSPKKGTIDLRRCWTRPANPYYPAWDVFCFWAQASPPRAESIRLPMQTGRAVSGRPQNPAASGPYNLACFQRANNRVVALLYTGSPASGPVTLDLSATGWPIATKLKAYVSSERIDFQTGDHTALGQKSFDLQLNEKRVAVLDVGPLEGFTSITLQPVSSEQLIEIGDLIAPRQIEVGQAIHAAVVLHNTGTKTWQTKSLKVFACEPGPPCSSLPVSAARGQLKANVVPGDSTLVNLELPPQQAPGRANFNLRLADPARGWLGPMFTVSLAVSDSIAPRKLVALRERDHVRLKWFAPTISAGPVTYELERADGFEQPFRLLCSLNGTEYVDASVQLDRAYYYRVVAIDGQKFRSRPSNEDNASALSQPRLYDAEIVSHTVPAEIKMGDTTNITIQVRNTGSKAWDLSRPDQLRFWFQSAQLWNRQDDEHLPQYPLADRKTVEPGETIAVSFPYAAPRPGRFENHWVMRLAVPSKGRTTGWDEKVRQAWFGSPLLVETLVSAN